MVDHSEEGGYVVVHPMFDVPEEKVNIDSLGPIQLSRTAKFALGAVRFYLVAIMLAGTWRAVAFLLRAKR